MPQNLEVCVVHGAEYLSANDVPVVIGPTTNNRIELGDEVTGLRCLVGLYDPSNLCKERLDVLFRRLDKELAVILANILPEKIETVLYVRDGRFLWREFKTSLRQELLNQRFNDFLQQLF